MTHWVQHHRGYSCQEFLRVHCEKIPLSQNFYTSTATDASDKYEVWDQSILKQSIPKQSILHCWGTARGLFPIYHDTDRDKAKEAMLMLVEVLPNSPKSKTTQHCQPLIYKTVVISIVAHLLYIFQVCLVENVHHEWRRKKRERFLVRKAPPTFPLKMDLMTSKWYTICNCYRS